MTLALGLLGAVVGLLLALTGGGGSMIAVPLLMFGMGWPIQQAAAVSMVAVATSAAVGAAGGLRAGIVRYRAATLMAATGIPLAPVGLALGHRLPPALLTCAFAALLCWIAVRMIRHARAPEPAGDVAVGPTAPCLLDPGTGRFRWTPRCGKALATAGLGTGVLSGLFGVGGGFLIVPALKRVTDLPMNSVIATSMMVIAIISTSAAAMSWFDGRWSMAVALPFVAGACIGVLVGRKFAARVHGPALQIGFACFCFAVAAALVAKTVWTLR